MATVFMWSSSNMWWFWAICIYYQRIKSIYLSYLKCCNLLWTWHHHYTVRQWENVLLPFKCHFSKIGVAWRNVFRHCVRFIRLCLMAKCICRIFNEPISRPCQVGCHGQFFFCQSLLIARSWSEVQDSEVSHHHGARLACNIVGTEWDNASLPQVFQGRPKTNAHCTDVSQ